MSHRCAAMLFAATLVLALAWVAIFSSVGAANVGAGQSLVVVFPPRMPAAEVIMRVESAGAHLFAPLRIGNAWVVQARNMSGLSGALIGRGALFAVRVPARLNFGLGCYPLTRSGR